MSSRLLPVLYQSPNYFLKIVFSRSLVHVVENVVCASITSRPLPQPLPLPSSSCWTAIIIPPSVVGIPGCAGVYDDESHSIRPIFHRWLGRLGFGPFITMRASRPVRKSCQWEKYIEKCRWVQWMLWDEIASIPIFIWGVVSMSYIDVNTSKNCINPV